MTVLFIRSKAKDPSTAPIASAAPRSPDHKANSSYSVRANLLVSSEMIMEEFTQVTLNFAG